MDPPPFSPHDDKGVDGPGRDGTLAVGVVQHVTQGPGHTVLGYKYGRDAEPARRGPKTFHSCTQKSQPYRLILIPVLTSTGGTRKRTIIKEERLSTRSK